jgi:hypothetical protein
MPWLSYEHQRMKRSLFETLHLYQSRKLSNVREINNNYHQHQRVCALYEKEEASESSDNERCRLMLGRWHIIKQLFFAQEAQSLMCQNSEPQKFFYGVSNGKCLYL